ncbi:MAG: tyrosine-type recombinase/integrase [Campylobacterales bacterium]
MKMHFNLLKEIEEFLEFIANIRGYSKESIRTYKTILEDARSSIKIELEDGIYEINIIEYRKKIAHQNKKTISKKLSAIRSFCEYLKSRGYKNRLIGDSSVKIPKTLPKPAQEKDILNTIKEQPLEERLLVLILYGLGLRVSEVSHLKLEDIKTQWIRVTGKGEKTRDIPLLKSIKDDIETFVSLKNPKIYLFEKNGEKLSENSLRYRISRIFEKIGKKVTPHQLRHSFATDLLNSGAGIMDVKELLGHSSLGTTEIYTKLNSKTKLKNYLSTHPLCKDSDES